VKATNAAEIFRMRDVDGGLIGGAALVAEELLPSAGRQRVEKRRDEIAMETLILIFHVLAALCVIGLVLLQHGKGADMGAAFAAVRLGACSARADRPTFLAGPPAFLLRCFS